MHRIDLNSIAGYRSKLISQGEFIKEKSSILIVVGRQDTGDLEAQIRGSRHAWDIRLISIDSLFRLMTLKEEVEDPRIIGQICAILIPREFTRVDSIIDIVFLATEDVRQEEEEFEDEDEEENEPPSDIERIKFKPVSFHDACILSIQSYIGQPLLKRSKTTYSSSDGKTALFCAVSKKHIKRNHSYWFSFHPHQQKHLESAEYGLISLGCGSANTILVIPYNDFSDWLDGMNITDNDRFYWHISVFKEGEKLILHRRKGKERIDLSKYLLPNS
jgi:hypothetical protein